MAACSFQLYLVTDRHRTGGRPLLEVVEAALQGGVGAVQLREKDLPAAELFDLACHLRQLCHRHAARLLINDRIDVALATGADGVQLPADSFTPAAARRLLGPHALIGASAHSLDQARAAAAGGADFIVFGPVYDTPAKRRYGPPVGLAALAAAAHSINRPIFGIGGIRLDRVAVVRRHGVCLAVVSAILEARDPRAAAAALAGAL
ncbi:MAG: thiamine phosphate synthase [Candidatus Binatia bacterium]